MAPEEREERRRARRCLSYAIRFAIDCDDEPSDLNLKRVLDRCAQPPGTGEYPAIRELVARYRAGEVKEEQPPPPPRTWIEEMTDDPWWYEKQVTAFTKMNREELLQEARNWAWNARLWKLSEIQARKSADWMLADNARTLQRAWDLYLSARDQKTIATARLGIALAKCEMCSARYATQADGRYLICDQCQADKDSAALA
jgi:hypothetical protein